MIRRPATILALLTALNFLNYLDRMVVAAVLPKIQAELGFSDTVAGSLATVFLAGYVVTGPLFARIADRTGRKVLIAVGVATWSIATFASGLAVGTLSLVAARMVVGVGEASYGTLAPTIIDDLAPPAKRSRWLSIFFLATPVGSALGYLVGGQVERAYGWRAAFYVAGVPGIVAGAACLLLAEPARTAVKQGGSFLGDARHLLGHRLYRRGMLGYTAATAALGAFAFWAPSFLYRTYAMPLAQANVSFGLVTVAGGALGTLLGGAWADRRARATPPGAAEGSGVPDGEDRSAVLGNLSVCAWSGLLSAPFAVGAFLAPSRATFFVLCFLCETCIFLGTSPINAVLLRSVPTELRARGLALAILSIHVLGDLWSPPAVGFLADQSTLRQAMMVLPAALAAAGFFWWVRPPRGAKAA